MALDLRYNSPQTGTSLGASTLFNGNISQMMWATSSAQGQAGTPAGYGFTYDGLNRLRSAAYADGIGYTANAGRYSTTYSYDDNGNIKTLTRNLDGNQVDNLGYTYYSGGNRLQAVADNVSNATYKALGYKAASGNYLYDNNGNMTYDISKGFTLTYNSLNLPQLVSSSVTDYARYTYDAAGTKLAKTVVTNGTAENILNYRYSGIFLYEGKENLTLTSIFTPEGRIVPQNNGTAMSYSYEYNLKDHLGNTRVTFTGHANGRPEVNQLTSYDPYGLVTSQTSFYPTGASKNKLLYNGKEIQDDVLAGTKIDWFDYGARFYDPQLGRWHSVDPKAEQYYSCSPYHFSANNPLVFIDLDGQSYYYGADGTFLFQTNDKKDDVLYWNQNKENQRQNENGDCETYYGGFDALQHKGKTVQNGDLTLLASTAYGESSEQNVADEVYGISNAIVNNMDARGKDATLQGTINGFAFAATDGNDRTNQFNNTSATDRNGTFMQMAIGGAINALSGGCDYSNGATHWAGVDIGSSKEKRATGGLLFTDQSHDMFNLGSKTATGAPISTYWYDKKGNATSIRGSYSYTWQTTAISGGTTFMKKTDKFIKATAAPRY